jgi:hypothetical protein
MFNFKPRKKDFQNIKKFISLHLADLITHKNVIPLDVFDVTLFYLEEYLDIYESIDILMQNDHFRGCLPLARSLLENSINLQYVYNKDTEQRAKNFKLAAVNSMLKRLKDFKGDSPKVNEMKATYENLLKNYKPEHKNLKEKAEEVGSQSLYKDSYKRLSEFVHSSYKADRNLDAVRPYTTYLKKIVFPDTILVTLLTLQSVCEKLDLDGGIMVIDDSAYDGLIVFSTNPKKTKVAASD